MATKAQIISNARSMGVPESLLTGTKQDIEGAIAGWEDAQLEASLDTATAISDDLVEEYGAARPRATAAGPFMLLGVLGSALLK